MKSGIVSLRRVAPLIFGVMYQFPNYTASFARMYGFSVTEAAGGGKAVAVHPT